MKKEKQTLLGCLRERNFSAFKKFLLSPQSNEIKPRDEEKFFMRAPEKWLFTYLVINAPYPETERVILTSCSDTVLKKTVLLHGLRQENLLWLFREGEKDKCLTVLASTIEKLDEEVEEAMLLRGDIDIFNAWLDEFGELSENGERLLENTYALQTFKSVYIDRQIRG